jgi:hypothetical protein
MGKWQFVRGSFRFQIQAGNLRDFGFDITFDPSPVSNLAAAAFTNKPLLL